MTSAVEHCRVVLAAIIPNRRDLLDKAVKHLTPDHFPDSELRSMFILLEKYKAATGEIIRKTALSDLLKGKDAGKVAHFTELYDFLHDLEADAADFTWSLEQIRELAAERETEKALVEAREILVRGLEDEKGRMLKGHNDSRDHFIKRSAEIESQLLMQEAPEGDMREEADEILAEYAEGEKKRKQGKGQGVLLGIPEWDRKIGGFHDGYLVLIAGASGSGKSSLLSQIAWNACVNQGLNVAVMTTETVRPNMRTKILCRHSKLPQFGFPEGLDSKKIIEKELSEEEKEIYQNVIADFTNNPSYGHLYIAQMPDGANLGAVKSRLVQEQRKYNVDVCLIDYLQLYHAERKRTSDREEQASLVKAAKQIAVTFDEGRGIPIISPWQVNRTEHKQAKLVDYYTTAALAETAESVNSSDVVLSLLEPDENETRHVNLKAQTLKHRYGPKTAVLDISADYATCTFTSASTGGRVEDLFSGENPFTEL